MSLPLQDAYEAGYAARVNGSTVPNPYGENDSRYYEWLKGWGDADQDAWNVDGDDET